MLGKAPLTESQKNDLIDLFELFDTDGGGSLDADEIKIALLTLGFTGVDDDEVEDHVRQLTGDDDEEDGLNKEQFLMLVTEKVSQRSLRKEHKEAFNYMTKDERYLKITDILEIAREKDEDTDDELRNMWSYLDIGSDGYMSEEQFLQLMDDDSKHHL